jgi:hypothetical protein
VQLKALALAFLLGAAGTAHAQMYKCKDERGITHYSDKPLPAGCKGGKVDIQGSPPLSGSVAPQQGNVAGQDADFKRRQIERDEVETHAQQAAAMKCAKLKYEFGVLSGGGVVYRRNSLGERVYLEDSARDKRLAELREEMRGCP